MGLVYVSLICIDNLHIESAQKAIDKSIEYINFKEVIFLKDIKIKSKEDYSKFCIKELHKYIQTEFMLLIQYDGYIINPHLWLNEYLKFDYIGAPWWYNDKMNVGNGGFSFRSKRLMEYISKMNINKCHPEDDVICRQNYNELIRNGFKFANEYIASIFSFEQNNKHNKFKNNTFGFHAVQKLIL